MWISFIVVFCIGSAVGFIEIASRHTDYRFVAARSAPGLIYGCMNGGVSILALALIEYTAPSWLGFRPTGDPGHGDPLMCILVAGFGSAAFLRSSIFRLQAGEKEISVGPALIVEQLLGIVDELVDRQIAEVRLLDISAIMAPVSFGKALANLPTLCFASLKRLPKDRQEQVAIQIQALDKAVHLDERVKTDSLGLTLMAVTGKRVLARAVIQLGAIIAAEVARSQPKDPDAVR